MTAWYVPRLAVVGVGLLGASVALAARQCRVAGHVIGVDRDPDTLEFCRDRGGLHEIATDLLIAATADVVVICTPVDQIVRQVLTLAPHCRPGTVLTDVGSTKAAIVGELADRLPPDIYFVGGHPLAGSEKQGAAHAHAGMFQNRLVVVTPGPDAAEEAVESICTFWEVLGAHCRRMSAGEHDQALALTSHLPHVVASALAGILPPHLADLTATGFRDTTRLAASGPELWTGILLSNRGEVLAALEHYRGQLERFYTALAANDGEGIRRLLAEGKELRDGLSG
jgi:prephenate dehydrogenase